MKKAETQQPAFTASRILTTRLVRGILEGAWPAGGKLPTEREMHTAFGVSRHVVREALKRLEAIGLVRIQQGSGAWVNDVFLSGGIELFEYLLLDEHGVVDTGALQDFFAFWKDFLPGAYGLAARNRSEKDLDDLRRLIEEHRQYRDDPERLIENNQRIIQIIVRATRNTIYQLIVNNVFRVIQRLRSEIALDALLPLIRQEHLERVLEAITQQDADMATLLAARQVETSAAFLLEHFQSQARHPG